MQVKCGRALGGGRKLDASVVVITREVNDSVLALLDALKSQKTGKSFEVVVVSEVPVPREKLALFSGVKLVPVPFGRGYGFNRNAGIRNSAGRAVAFVDSDCLPKENWLDCLLKPLDQGFDAATGGSVVMDSNFFGNAVSALGFPGGGSIGFDKMWRVSGNGLTDHICTGNGAVKRSVFAKVGLFDQSLRPGGEDAEFSVRLARAKVKIRYYPDAAVFHKPRDDLPTFARWQFGRGQANYHFKRRVGDVWQFVALRLWSSKNVLKASLCSPGFPLVFFLLSSSFVLQQAGFLFERARHSRAFGRISA